MISDWEIQIKAQIKRRFAQQAESQTSNINRLMLSGYPSNLIKSLPLNLAKQYSGCGYLFNNISFDGNETVLDLGSGAGIDSYIASRFLNTGKVFSVDMTFEMLLNHNIHNIKQICADIEYLPIISSHIDLIIANASFNLSISKEKAFMEAFRVLKGNGRLVMRDLIKVSELPQEILADPLSYNTSLGGVLDEDSLRLQIENVGFVDIVFSEYRAFSYVVSIKIEARKP